MRRVCGLISSKVLGLGICTNPRVYHMTPQLVITIGTCAIMISQQSWFMWNIMLILYPDYPCIGIAIVVAKKRQKNSKFKYSAVINICVCLPVFLLN